MAKKKGDKADNAESTQKAQLPGRINGRFAKGHSGNPAGMPPGTKHRATRAAELLLEGQLEAITQAVIDAALKGDMLAGRLCLERVLPARKDRHFQFESHDLQKPEDALATIGAIVNATATGNLTVPEAVGLANIVGAFVKTIEATELKARIEQLKEHIKAKQS